MKRIIVVLPLLALVTACVPKPPNIIWEKPSATPEEFGTDKYTCLQDAVSKAPTVAGTFGGYYGDSAYLASSNMNAGLQQELFIGCMESKGYHIESPAHKQYWDKIKDSVKQVARASKDCRQKRISGILKDHKETAICTNQKMLEIYKHNGFPRMDLIKDLADKNIDISEKVDSKEITPLQAAKQLDSYANSLWLSGQPE
jgi:hypothetical protein